MFLYDSLYPSFLTECSAYSHDSKAQSTKHFTLCPGQSHSEVLRVKAVTDEFGGGVRAAGKDTVDSSTHKSSSGGCMWKPIREVGED